MNSILLVAFILEATFGAAFLLVPAATMAPYGVTLNDFGSAAVRLLGSALLALAVLLWLARRAESVEVKRIAVHTLFAYYCLSSIVVLYIQLSGLLNLLGWGMVATHVAFATWFGYASVRR